MDTPERPIRLEDVQHDPGQYVDDLVHDVLDESQAAVVREWCASSEEGAQALREAEARKGLLEAVGKLDPDPSLIQRTMERLDQKVARRSKAWRTYRRSVVWATAAAVVIIAALQVHYVTMKPSPYDLRIIGQNAWNAGGTGSMQVVVRDVRNDELVDGVPIELVLRNDAGNQTITLASFRSGEPTPRFEIPDWSAGDYQLEVRADIKGGTETVRRAIEMRRPWKLMLSTDKPLYQPGQTIHMRSLSLRRPSLVPIEGEPVTFRLIDGQGNVVFKETVESSEHGIASTECQLANEIRLGNYDVECNVGSTTSERSVQIDRYVLPKIKVGIRFDQRSYQPGQDLEVVVEGQYVFGEPVAGGTAKLWLMADGQDDPLQGPIALDLDDQGLATFDLKLPDTLVGRPQEGGDARIRAIALIEDSAGQQNAASVSRRVSRFPIQIEVVPESPLLVPDVENSIYLMTTYADGTAAKTTVSINDETTVTTNDLGIARFSIVPGSEEVRMTVVAEDSEGRKGISTAQLTKMSSTHGFLVRTDKSIYAGSDTITVDVLGHGQQPVFVDLIKDNQTVLSQIVDVDSNGEGTLDIDLPQDVFGTLRLEAYRFASSGLPRRQTRVLVVTQANELNVSTRLSQEEYRPGEPIEMELRVTDAEGNARPGAVGLSIVDEALYALLDRPAGMEQRFFLLEEELLKPTYAIYPGFSPFGAPPADDEDDRDDWVMLQQAVFAKTAYASNGVTAVRMSGESTPPGERRENAGWQYVDPETGDRERVTHVNPYTLAITNYQHKVQQVEERRDSGLQSCVRAWIASGITLVVVLIGGFAFAYPLRFAYASIGFLAVATVGGCLFFGIQSAKMGADRAVEAKSEQESMPTDDRGWAGSAAGADMDTPMAINQESFPQRSQPQPPPRVREYFPETLFWNPEIVTDDQGVAKVSIPGADSITTWRVAANAVSKQGELGALESSIRVFQPFQVDLDIPTALTRGDEIGMPIVIYNFSPEAQTVTWSVHGDDWFEELPGAESDRQVQIASGDVIAIEYPIRVTQVGTHEIEVSVQGAGLQDAIRRQVRVVPDGRRVVETRSGNLLAATEITIEIPQDVIDGSVSAQVYLYPTTFSQLVEGLDAIFRRPHGCFEQTSSTTYPNVLALNYLRENNLSVPEVEAKARQYIHLGYQRLLSFEISGGGFDWYGNPPASVPLSAYGLMQFQDMANVHDVDPAVLNRTRQYLLSNRQRDGSWHDPSGRTVGWVTMAETPELERVVLTAMVAWAVFSNGNMAAQAEPTKNYLLAVEPATTSDPYLLALIINAMVAMGAHPDQVQPYVAQLLATKTTNDDETQVWWERPDGLRTVMYGSGNGGRVEVTALATLALINSNADMRLVPAALNWIAAQKDEHGLWHSTQATILALKALLRGTNVPAASGDERTIVIDADAMRSHTVVITPDQQEVVQQLSLSTLLAEVGAHTVTIEDQSEHATAFRFDLSYHVPAEEEIAVDEPLKIEIDYDRRQLQVDETVSANARVVNQTDGVLPMVMLDLPIPAGFAVERDTLDAAVNLGIIAKYQVTQRQIIVYLRGLEPGVTLELPYLLRATMPVKVSVPAARAYEYYNPARESRTPATRFEVTTT